MKRKTTLTDKIIKKSSIVVLIALIALFVVGISIGCYYFYSLLPVNSDAKEKITFELEKGWGLNKVADELEKKGLIKNSFTFKIYIKLNNDKSFLAGTYSLSKNMSVNDIVIDLTTGASVLDDSISVTFVEGKRFPYYAQKIADTFGYTYDEVINKTSDEEYLNSLIKKYWFIENDILSKELYYPLEGYIFPDTYSFKKNATIEEIIEKMLDAMGEKLVTYKSEIELSSIKFHGLLTLASVVELEAVTPDDRLLVAGVFYNRINANDSLGSDVTTYYGVKKDITESLFQSEINRCNAYNTRGNCNSGKLPVGPIASPSLSSIVAAITPEKTKYYYFVADVNNKLYFAETEAGHQKNIDDLINKGIWPE